MYKYIYILDELKRQQEFICCFFFNNPNNTNQNQIATQPNNDNDKLYNSVPLECGQVGFILLS